jgi:hypothetical protein
MMFVPHRKHTYGPARPVTEIASQFYMQMIFLPERKHTYWPPRPVTGRGFLFYFPSKFLTRLLTKLLPGERGAVCFSFRTSAPPLHCYRSLSSCSCRSLHTTLGHSRLEYGANITTAPTQRYSDTARAKRLLSDASRRRNRI